MGLVDYYNIKAFFVEGIYIMPKFKMTRRDGLTHLDGETKGDIEINAPDEDFVIEDSLECDGAISIVGRKLIIRGELKSGEDIELFMSGKIDSKGSIVSGHNFENQLDIISTAVINKDLPDIKNSGVIIAGEVAIIPLGEIENYVPITSSDDIIIPAGMSIQNQGSIILQGHITTISELVNCAMSVIGGDSIEMSSGSNIEA